MTSTQVCDVCCSNIDSVAHAIISYTNETNVFTMDIRCISNPLIANIVSVIFFLVSFFFVDWFMYLLNAVIVYIVKLDR